jgi:hypothetical protein
MTFWEQTARTRWGAYMTEGEERVILDGEALARPAGCALEIGCEGGRCARLLAVRGWRMTCTDVDASALETFLARLPDAQCIRVFPGERSISRATREWI